MTLKELCKDVTSIEIEVDAIPRSFMSKRYHKHIALRPSEDMRIMLDCPNGTCTARVMVITHDEVQAAISKALQGDGTFEIKKQCLGFEDEERKRTETFHCLTDFILKGRVLTARRNL